MPWTIDIIATGQSCCLEETLNWKVARWPRRTWTTVFTYVAIYAIFPLLCLLAYAFVNGWLF